MGGDGEGQAHVHAAGVALDRRVEKALDLGEGDDFVELAADLGAAHAEDGAVEEDVFAAGQLRMKAGADFEQAADAAVEVRAAPVGSVMRERILSSVLLPAPLRPMMPTTSPSCTSNETSPNRPNGVLGARPAVEGAADGSGEGVAEMLVAFAFADAVELADAFDANGDVRHPQSLKCPFRGRIAPFLLTKSD